MNDQPAAGPQIPDALEFAQAMAHLAERSQRIVGDFLAHKAGDGLGMADPFNIGAAFLEMTTRLMTDPAKLLTSQMSLWQAHMDLWQSAARRMMGDADASAAEPAPDDRRFKDAAWEENLLFDFIKQSYLLSARWLTQTVREVDGLDDKTAKKIDFYTRQFVDAMAPTNFLLTNPEVLRATVESRGENLVKGLENLLEDLERGKGKLHIKMTDLEAFRVGENIAVTPGQVVYRNDLIELLQYDPTTDKVCKRPLLIIPPWINKFYILDLREKNSFIKWAVAEGHTVFVVSWVNPDESLAAKSFEDYMLEGPLAALDAMEKATGEASANVIGYCLGGTLLACTLAYMAARKDTRVASATMFASLVDFKEPGELGVFIDEEQLAALEERMSEKGYLEGGAMATTFNMLRANDLIWSFVVNNYLLGKDPFPFDLLYWNSDSTRMPAAMHSFYLRNMYLENRLVQPGGITLAGEALDLRDIDLPIYQLSTESDHIAPWKSTYALSQLVRGPYRFVLSGSGHIAGVINPPAASKYYYLTNSANPPTPEEWLAGAARNNGSWWTDWAAWVAPQGGGLVPAREPGAGALAAIEDAPGSYVRVRAGD